MTKRVSTVVFINGKGCMYLPKGNSNTKGVKWYADKYKEDKERTEPFVPQ